MTIIRLELHKYKRFFLNHIETLVYQPDKNMQVITGRNSCGKSSLLKELNVLPADLKNEYREGGYKLVEVEHNGETYIISSGKTGVNKHSIVRNGEELNPGGTKKVQLDVIKDIFGVTPEIIDILLNNIRLTTMSVSDRKRWLSNMSGIDYTFPITVYNNLRSRVRDVVGGIKLSQEEIVRESEKIVDDDKYKELEEAQTKIEELITALATEYDNNVRADDTSGTMSLINSHSSELSGYLIELGDKTLVKIEEAETELKVNLTKIEHLEEKIKKLNKDIDILDQFDNSVDIEQLNKDKAMLIQELYELKKTMTYELDLDKVVEYQSKYASVYADIMTELEELKSLDEFRIYTGEKTQELENKLERAKQAERITQYRIEVTNRDIEHMEKHSRENIVNCPKCSHQWSHGFDQDKMTSWKKSLEDDKNTLHKLQEGVSKLDELFRKVKTKGEVLDRLKSLLRSLPELKEVWSIIMSGIDIHSTEMYKIFQAFDNMNLVLHRYVDIANKQEHLKTIEERIKKYNEVVELRAKLNIDKRDVLIKQLDDLTSAVSKLKERNNELWNDIGLSKNIRASYDNLYKSLKDISSSITREIAVERNKMIVKLTNLFKSELVNIQAKISEGKLSKAKLDNCRKNIDEYKVIDSVLSKVVKELGPTEGLIAKSINSFLNVFVQEMNQVINSIWSYDVELLPCELSEGNDLDYKFRVKINNDEIVSDVSKLSSSMKEVVDLAFRMVFCKYMKLIEMPLYLDEFGATFDSKHRSLAYAVIDKIIGSDYKQVFIVCHYESLYGSMKNVDFNVLDPNNIETSSMSSYNSCLELTME